MATPPTCSLPGHAGRPAVAVALAVSGDPADPADWRPVCAGCVASQRYPAVLAGPPLAGEGRPGRHGRVRS